MDFFFKFLEFVKNYLKSWVFGLVWSSLSLISVLLNLAVIIIISYVFSSMHYAYLQYQHISYLFIILACFIIFFILLSIFFVMFASYVDTQNQEKYVCCLFKLSNALTTPCFLVDSIYLLL